MLKNTWIITQSRQVQGFIRPLFPSDMIFTKSDASTSDEQVEKSTRELNIHYRACIGSLIYLLSTRVDLSFAVHKLAKFLLNPGKVHFEGFNKNFANLCTTKLKSTLVDNK